MNRRLLLIIAYAIAILLLIQSLTVLVEAVYMLELLQTGLDEKAAAILVLLAPLLLLLAKRESRWLRWVLGVLLVGGRGAIPYLDTFPRLLASALGTAVGLMLLPLMLAGQPSDDEPDPGIPAAGGLALALVISILLRTLGHTFDVSLDAGGSWVGWLLGVGLLVLLRGFGDTVAGPIVRPASGGASATSGKARPLAAGVGIMMLLGLAYMAFSSPGVMARWGQANYVLVVGGTSLMATLGAAAVLWRPAWVSRIGRGWLAAWNLGFGLALVGAILAHGVAYPATPNSPAADVVGTPTLVQQLPLALAILLFPVIMVDLAALARRVVGKGLPLSRLAPGFALGGFLLLVLIFANIFTNVWGYVEPVSTWFRGKYWLPFAVLAAVGCGLAVAVHRRARAPEIRALQPLPVAAMVVALIATIGAAALTAIPDASPSEPAGELVLMTYNIQQGVDADGEKARHRQLALMREVGADIIALQESDPARISLGNNDLVRFYAAKLGYHQFYGPTTVAGTFGTAILSRYPLVSTATFFTFSDQDEVGTAMATVQVERRFFAVLNVHPDGSDDAKLDMVDEVLAHASLGGDVIALGDYNARPDSEPYARMAASHVNAWSSMYPGEEPEHSRIDHIFLSPELKVTDAVYLPSPESHTDHPAHWATIRY